MCHGSNPEAPDAHSSQLNTYLQPQPHFSHQPEPTSSSQCALHGTTLRPTSHGTHRHWHWHSRFRFRTTDRHAGFCRACELSVVLCCAEAALPAEYSLNTFVDKKNTPRERESERCRVAYPFFGTPLDLKLVELKCILRSSSLFHLHSGVCPPRWTDGHALE